MFEIPIQMDEVSSDKADNFNNALYLSLRLNDNNLCQFTNN